MHISKAAYDNLKGAFEVEPGKDCYIDGQNTQLISFEKMSTGPPNYTTGVDFFDCDLL